MFNKGMMNWLSIVVTAFMLIFIVIIFGILETGTARSINQNVQDIETEVDATINLIRFLNTPYHDSDIRSLLIDSYYKSDFGEFQVLAEDFFDPYYEQTKKSWRLKITEQPEDDEVAKFKGIKFAKCEGLSSLLAECKKITPLAVVKLAVKGDGVGYLQIELSSAQLK